MHRKVTDSYATIFAFSATRKPSTRQHVRQLKDTVPSDGVDYQMAVDAAPPVEEVPQRRTLVCTCLSCMIKQEATQE